MKFPKAALQDTKEMCPWHQCEPRTPFDHDGTDPQCTKPLWAFWAQPSQEDVLRKWPLDRGNIDKITICIFYLYVNIYICIYVYLWFTSAWIFIGHVFIVRICVNFWCHWTHPQKNYQSKQNFGLKSYWKFMAQKIHGVVRINVCLLYVYVCCAWSLISKIPFRDPKIIQEHFLFDLWVDDMVFCLI